MLSTMYKTLKSLVAPDQQSIGRVADKRRSPPVSALPSLATRETADANYRTRTPVIENMKTMNRNREHLDHRGYPRPAPERD